MIFSLIVMIYLPACKKQTIFQPKEKPEATINAGDGRLNAANIHLVKDTVYILATNLNINSGQALTIDAGTLIKVNSLLSITINAGAVIEAKGTASEPIVFTSSAYTGSAGVLINGGQSGVRYWYGIRIYGTAASASPVSSGDMSYVRIEFAGGDENASGLPCLLFKDVTDQTNIGDIQVSYAFSTPSFEFSGGNCNARNLVSYATVSTDFYIHNGYKGMLQNLLAYRHPYFASPSPGPRFAGVILEDSATFPSISNLTVLGPDLQRGTQGSYSDTVSNGVFSQGRPVAAMITTSGSKFHIRNSVLMGFPRGGWYLDNDSSAVALYYGKSDFTYSIVHSNDSSKVFYLSPKTYPPFTSKDFRDLVMRPEFANKIFLNSGDFQFTDPYNYDIDPNPLPAPGSPLLSGANFDGDFDNGFFKKVDYVGAVGPDNWLAGWTNFLATQTTYND